jgi:lipopolysaccharide biosynthesis protein
VEQKPMFRKILDFAYWKRIWLANYFRAAVRYIRNRAVSASRIVRNRAVSASRISRNYDNLSRKDMLGFLKQRFTYRKLGAAEKKWIYVTKSNLVEVPSQRVVSANLIFHVHYLEIAVEMIDYLMKSKVVFKNVVITCTDDDFRPFLERATKNLAQDGLEVITVENSYRDARPFLIALHRLADNLPILKIHTKKSPHLSELDGTAWRQSLLKGLVPDAIHAERFSAWLESESVPMVICPKEWLAKRKHWGQNDIHVYSICQALGITMVRKAPFPMGTMFWANKELVDEIKKSPIPGSQELREAHWADSTWAHGFERVIGQIVANSGKGVALD